MKTWFCSRIDDVFGNGLGGLIEEGFGGEVAIIKYAPDPPDLSGEVSSASAEVARFLCRGEHRLLLHLLPG